MAIDQGIVCFPNNIVEMLTDSLRSIDPETEDGRNDGLRVLRRPIHPTDQTETVAVFPTTWNPVVDSFELGNREPTLQRYSVTVEAMVTDVEEERGIAAHSLLSALVRHKLYRDPALKVALPMLSVNLGSYSEKLHNWGINQQRFQNNKFGGVFYYLSTMDLWFETDINAI